MARGERGGRGIRRDLNARQTGFEVVNSGDHFVLESPLIALGCVSRLYERRDKINQSVDPFVRVRGRGDVT